MINYKMLINKNNTIYNINLLNNKYKSIFFLSFSCHGLYFRSLFLFKSSRNTTTGLVCDVLTDHVYHDVVHLICFFFFFFFFFFFMSALNLFLVQKGTRLILVMHMSSSFLEIDESLMGLKNYSRFKTKPFLVRFIKVLLINIKQVHRRTIKKLRSKS